MLEKIERLLESHSTAEVRDFFEEYRKKHDYYEEIALHGRDSDDARGCRMCDGSPESFIRLDLEEGLDV